MAEMFGAALVQEAVSRVVSFALGKREDKASQGHLMERLEMATSLLEFALERTMEVPITHVSLLGRRKMIKSAYAEALELLDRHKQQQIAPVGQEEIPQGAKRKRWIIWARSKSITPFAGLGMDDVRRFEWYADCAAKFVRDLESGCSLHHYTFCNPIVRHLLEGKTLWYYHSEKENQELGFFIWSMRSDERGVEAELVYRYKDSTMIEKCFTLNLGGLRLSESTDIVQVAIKALQLWTSGFKLSVESAMGQLITILSNLQDLANLYVPPLLVGIQEQYINQTQLHRPDPACCKGGLSVNNNIVSSELSDIYPEQVTICAFEFYYVPALEPGSSCSSFHVVGRSMPPLQLTALFLPHQPTEMEDRYGVEIEVIGDAKKLRDPSNIQQVTERLKSDVTNCFFRQPELPEYQLFWRSRHGIAGFLVKKVSMERPGGPITRRRYNTRGSTSKRRRS